MITSDASSSASILAMLIANGLRENDFIEFARNFK